MSGELSNKSIFAAFDAVVAKYPQATALLGQSASKTYKDLHNDVLALAATLDAHGVVAGDAVGLFASRSMGAITAMLACLHRGAIYVPLDPTFAPEQLAFIAGDIPLRLVLSTKTYFRDAQKLFDGHDVKVFDVGESAPVTNSQISAAISADSAACILYTSGTTGRPKGVMIPHRAIMSMALCQPEMAIFPDDVVLSTTTIACDGALAEVFRPLLNGAAIALVETPTPDIKVIADTMIKHKVTVTFWYAGMHHLVIAHRIDAFETLRFCQQGGDVMSVPMAKKLLTAWPELRLFNGFGPTETCFNSIMHEVTLADLDKDAVAIGHAMTGEEAFILDENLRPVAPGTVGQIAIGGHGVALGYYNRPDATKAAFVTDPRTGHNGTLYLTGDLGLQDADGLFHFRGRADRQIKIAGRRVEIDGIEHILRELDGVSEAVVELVTDGDRGPRLIAFVTTEAVVADEAAFVAKMRATTAQDLARDIFPRKVVFRETLPLTKAGKVDRKALRESQSTTDPVVSKHSTKDARGIIAGIWQDILGGRTPNSTDTFFDLGGTSLQLIDAHAKIEAALGVRFAIAEIFARPKLGDLAAHFSVARDNHQATFAPDRSRATNDHAVAIVGMAARLPGGTALSAFWDVIRDGRSLIEKFDPSEAEDSFDSVTRASSAYVPARSILRHVDQFDPQFFDMRPREAALMDPQGRVFLEICQEALDDAGIDPVRTKGAIGVYAGAPISTYMLENLLQDRTATRNFTSGFQIDYAISAGNVAFDIATRVAYKLGLKGQAIAVSTACSTSLVAIAQACKALRAGDVDAVLAGGVSITFPQKRGYLYMESGMASADGKCRPFDAESSGTVFGHGAGVVVLKRLSDAMADGDHIHAVIRGVGLNNDGSDKMSYTAPTVTGQADAIRLAQRDAGVSPQDIGYLECHGTGTPLGDPIEIAGLAQAFGTAEGRCALGSVKGNLGHADAAAGVLGVIKAATVLKHKTIPPVAHFNKINNRIDLANTPFWVPDKAAPWNSESSRFAGVSSFGVGGTNAHIVMEQAPETVASKSETSSFHYLPLSAKSAAALPQMAAALATTLETQTDLALGDVAYTLQEGRREFGYRAVITARDRQEAITELRAVAAPQNPIKTGSPDVVFLFPGQGAQYPGMGADLYAAEPEFARWIDTGNDILAPIIGQNIRPLILGNELSPQEATVALRETKLTQPALYMTEYALGALWQSRGITPAAVIGHSVGEFAAAALAGVMSFEDALTLIAKRGELMQGQPGGSMLSVRATLEVLQPYLDETVDLAARNAPKLHVVAGPDVAIDALEVRLIAAGLACQRLHTSHAFHSKMMDPVTKVLEDAARMITFNAPACPIFSAVTGAELSTEQACDPAYWAAQARACVNFEAAVMAVAEAFDPVFVEVGPGRTLSTCAAQTLKRDQYQAAVQSLPDHTRPISDGKAMAQAAASLWSAGTAMNWSELGPRGARKVPLPSYAFQRQRCWVDPPEAATTAATQTVFPSTFSQEFAPMSVSAQTPVDRLPRLQTEICAILSDMSGDEIGAAEMSVSFIELGFDSLFLGQVSQTIAKSFGVQIGFRKLLGDVSTVTTLAQYLDAQMPAEEAVLPQSMAAPIAPQPVMRQAPVVTASGPIAGVEGLLQAQLQTMQAVFAQQLQAMGQGAITPTAASAAPAVSAPTPVVVSTPTADAALEAPVTFKLGRGASVTGGTLTDAQIAFAKDLAENYSEKHAKSKAYTATHRGVLADPRTAAGFRAEWKELTFPIVAERSKGAYIQDVDGNTFVDLVNGFGQTAFGHSPDFVRDAVAAQMEKGFPIGPQADLAGPVAQKFARVVGHERVTFCNTGSEAVMAAMRLARTVTGRDLIVVFDRDYHGQFDEVLIKGKTSGTSADALPIAPGIPRSGLVNMKVLKYGAPESLNWIRDNVQEIAGVVVEPVQSRHPALRPEEFVRALRDVTRDNGVALVIDEVVTGFRTDARGMQGVWGIQGDMATYGKVVGGGMPIGVLAGDAKFMDALDGGTWSFGDDSRPEAMPTFFAGTFVRHPLVLAAVDATLDHMAASGDALWKDTAARTAEVATQLSKILTDRDLPDLIETYSSWFVINVTEADPRATLLFPLMRMEGVHVMDGFCAFLTTEHGADECAKIVDAFEKAVDTLLAQGILRDLKGETTPQLPSSKAAASGPIPLTESQREIWMSHQFGGMAAAAFNESGLLDLNGALNVTALKSSWSSLVQRHDALRLRFARDGASFEVIEGDIPLPEVLDFSTHIDPKAALKALIEEDGATPFDITVEPPVRATLVKLAEALHVFVITAHHIVADGWSFGVMLSDLATLYSAAVKKTAADLPAAPSFARHALQEAAAGPNAQTTAFWTEMHTPVPALPDLPSDRPRPELRSYAGDTVFHEIDGDLVKAARKAGAKSGCTLFATTFAAMQILVHRISGADDFALGVPTAAQQNMDDPYLVGHCVNFLPIRIPIAQGVAFKDHLAVVRDQLNAALDHQDTTFGAIVRTLSVPRTLNRLPLAEIEFNLEQDKAMDRMSGLDATFRASAKRAVNFDLFFNVVETETGLRIEAHFNTDLFNKARVKGWARAYEAILTALAADTSQPVSTVSLMTSEAQQALLLSNTNVQEFDRTATLPDLIARAVAEQADAPAITDINGTISYSDLAVQSDALAALIQERVAGQGARIALCLRRDSGMVAGLLAILKAGHTYVPLDPNQPAARLRQIVETAQVQAILTSSADLAGFAEGAGIDLILTSDAKAAATPAPVTVSPEHAAYVIFTSGSTGVPKGVAVAHRALVNFLTSMANKPGFTTADKILAVTTVMFDIAALELLLPLTVGGQVEIAPTEMVVDGFKLAERLQQGDITMMQATPTLWDMALTAGFKARRGFTMLCGGEALPQDLADRLLARGGTLWNMYGPTETTIWSAIKKVEMDDAITIGEPIANTGLHILDDAGQIVPDGVVGELNISGEGLALGYFGQPDLTAQSFRDVKLGESSVRLYATGDLAQRTDNGEIAVLGRIDTQVKLRGFRIELGEIETRLRAIAGVAKAAVDLRQRKNGDGQLVAYMVAEKDADVSWDAVTAELAQDLPDYMVPRAFVMLSALPQTGNGKLDRKALPDPQETASVTPLHQIMPAETETEKRIAAIWGKVLERDQISVTETLHAQGVDSLAMFRIAAHMLNDGLNLEARHMFAHPSIRALASFHDGRKEEGPAVQRPSLKSYRDGAQRGRGKGVGK